MEERRAYKSDLTDAQWDRIKPLLPPPSDTGRPREHSMREILNTIFYQLRTGVQWDMLPNDLVNPSTAFYWFSKFKEDEVWQDIHASLRVSERLKFKKKKSRRRRSSTAKRSKR